MRERERDGEEEVLLLMILMSNSYISYEIKCQVLLINGDIGAKSRQTDRRLERIQKILKNKNRNM